MIEQTPVEAPTRIFIGNCPKDQQYLQPNSLLGYLSGLERDNVELWSELRLTTGSPWDEAIQQRLEWAQISLLLISQGFLDSEFCRAPLSGLMERRIEQGELRIVPVLLSPCEWRRHPWLSRRRMIPDDGRTLEEDFQAEGARKRIFHRIRDHLRHLIAECKPSQSPPSQGRPPVVSAPQGSVGSPPGTGERRQVLVMRCEVRPLDGRTTDPEDLLLWLPDLLMVAQSAVARFGGELITENPMDQGITACFGYPKAHADDAMRAVEACKEIIQAFADLTGAREPVPAAPDSPEHPHGPAFGVQIGLDTAAAAISVTPTGHSNIMLADLPDRARRLALEAPSGNLLISQATLPMIEGTYRCLALEHGGESCHSEDRYYTVHERITRAQLGAGASSISNAPIGRTQELELLLDRWSLAQEGMGQIALVSAEDGVGKTRLLTELKRRILATPRTQVELNGSPHHSDTPFFPITDFLDRFLAAESSGTHSDSYARDGEGAVIMPKIRKLSRLLASTASDELPLEHSSPAQGARTIREASEVFLEVAKIRPLLLLVEDFQWCDPSSRELLAQLAQQVPTLPALMVVTSTPGQEPQWSGRYNTTHLSLGRLAKRFASELVQQLAPDLGPEIRAQIVAKTDGVPLFIEELSRLMLDIQRTGGNALAQIDTIPATLRSWFTPRLDGLGPAKWLAQMASALGRSFTLEHLEAISDYDREPLEAHIQRLVDAEVLYRQGFGPSVELTFRHELLRQAAHESMLRRQRRETHHKITLVLRQEYGDWVADHPELMARHHQEAGAIHEAIRSWRAAAEKAIREAAHFEAASHAQRGLQLVRAAAGEGQNLDEFEASLQVALGIALSALRNFADPKAAAAYDRAETLNKTLDEPGARLRILSPLVHYRLSRGQIDDACTLADDLVQEASKAGSPRARASAQRSRGFANLLAGNLGAAESELEQGIEQSQLAVMVQRAPTECMSFPLMASLGDLSWAAWLQGHVDLALFYSNRSVSQARRQEDPFAHLLSLFRAAFLRAFLRQPSAARKLAAQLSGEAERRGYHFFVASGHFIDGYTLVAQGNSSEGILKMSEGLDGIWTTGMRAGLPRNQALLAEALGQQGEIAEGLSLLESATATAERTGERHYEAELHRLRGELLALDGAPRQSVRECFLRAQAVARRQGALAFELRAAKDLLRHGICSGHPELGEDRAVLFEICERFVGSAENLDLEDAHTLLAHRSDAA